MKRRALLAAATGATVGLAGCGGDPPDPWAEPPPSDQPKLDDVADSWGFDEVVDLGERGADPFGNDPLGPVLEDAVDDDRLLYLPAGRYLLEETWSFPSFSSFGLVGDQATIVPPQGYNGQLLVLGVPGEASRLLVDGLRFDFRAERTGGRPIAARVDDELVMRDVTVRGHQDVDTQTMRVDVASPDGVGLVERLRLPDGGSSNWSVTGCYVGDDTRGDITFVDCRIEGFSDNGLYAGPPEGRIRVLGGYYANNEVAGVRVNADPGSLVRGVHVRCDEAPEGFRNMRGIRLRGGSGILVEDCFVEMLDVTASDGAVVFSSALESATLRNTRIRVDADGVNAIRIKQPADGGLLDRDGPFRVEDVLITGEAATESAIKASNRGDCVFERLCVHQSGRDRMGVDAFGVNGAIRDSYFAVTGDPYQFRNSDIETVDISVRRLTDDGTSGGGGGCGG